MNVTIVLSAMLLCYICGEKKCNFSAFRTHINRHSNECELMRPIRCCQNGCQSTFVHTFNFFRHIKNFHLKHGEDNNSIEPAHVVDVINARDSDEMQCVDNDSSEETTTLGDVECGLGDAKVEGITLVASLRANSSIPYSVMPHVIQSVNEISRCLISACQEEAFRCFSQCVDGCDNDLLHKFKISFINKTNCLKQPLEFLDSKYKQDSFFNHHDAFVCPQSVNFGLRFETRCGRTKTVYDSFQYVSVQQTITALLMNEQFIRYLLRVQEKTSQCDVIGHYFDGELAKSQPIRYDSNSKKLILELQLFYDGMGTTNPLRGQSVMYNIGVFYYVIKNLPDAWNTSFANVHLLALCYSHDLKVHGFSPILDKFISEISTLSASGFQGVFPVIGNTTVYVNLCQLACDNLALNSILGFVESFSGDYFCTLCYATRDSIQDGYVEECFQMRTPSEYEKDVLALRCMKEPLVHVRGVKRACELNKLQSFHCTQNFSIDIMHTLLEGLVPLEVGCVLFSLITDKRLFSLAELNERVTEFWSLINVDKKKKPPHLNKVMPPGSGLNPSMKATQCWALLKYLPLIIGDKVPVGDEHYELLLHLSELVDLAFAPRFTTGLVAYMKEFIKDHLTMFVQLYGTKVSLKPKHHFLVHLPTIVVKSGPLVGMSCLKYELKNSFFKRSSHIVCNFINICKTLAYRHQNFALFSHMSNLHVRDCPVVNHISCMTVSSVLQGVVADLLSSVLQVDETADIMLSYKLLKASIEYQKGQYVVVDIVDDEYMFGVVEAFVCKTDDDMWHVLIRMFETVCYINHFHSFAIREKNPVTYQLLALSSLCDHHPVCSYVKRLEGHMVKFLRLPYHIFASN